MTTFSERFFSFLNKKDLSAANAMLADESAYLMSDSSYVTALHCASQNGYTTLVSSLLVLMSSTCINAVDDLGQTALHAASQFRHIAVVEILLPKMDQKAIDAQADGCTALHNAATNGDAPMVKILLGKMSDDAINAIDGARWTALMHASHTSDECVSLLLKRMSQAAIDAKDKSNVTALHIAAGEKRIETVMMLLARMSPNVIKMKNRFGERASDYPGMKLLQYVDRNGIMRFMS